MSRLALIAGMALPAAAWLMMVADWKGRSVLLSMGVHMSVVAVAAPLLAFGLRGSRFDLGERIPAVTPVLASMIELVIVWLWHIPALHRLAETEPVMAALEQSSFLVGGVILWGSCFGGRDLAPERRLSGVIGLLLTAMHMTLLGVLIALAPRPLYVQVETITCLGVSLPASFDQQLGGVVMLIAGGTSYLVGALALLSTLLKRHATVGRSG